MAAGATVSGVLRRSARDGALCLRAPLRASGGPRNPARSQGRGSRGRDRGRQGRSAGPGSRHPHARHNLRPRSRRGAAVRQGALTHGPAGAGSGDPAAHRPDPEASDPATATAARAPGGRRLRGDGAQDDGGAHREAHPATVGTDCRPGRDRERRRCPAPGVGTSRRRGGAHQPVQSGAEPAGRSRASPTPFGGSHRSRAAAPALPARERHASAVAWGIRVTMLGNPASFARPDYSDSGLNMSPSPPLHDFSDGCFRDQEFAAETGLRAPWPNVAVDCQGVPGGDSFREGAHELRPISGEIGRQESRPRARERSEDRPRLPSGGPVVTRRTPLRSPTKPTLGRRGSGQS